MFSGTLWGDWLLKKFSMFSALFGFERKTFGPQAKFFVNLVKTVFFISGGTVGGKTHFLKKKRIFRYFWTFTEFFIDLRQKLFPWGCKSFTLRVQRNKLWMKFFLPLSDTEQTEFGLQRNSWDRFLKTAFYVSRATFSENTASLKKNLSIKFRYLRKGFRPLAESFEQRFLDCTVRVHDNVFGLSVKIQVFRYVRFLNNFFTQFLAELCQCCFLIVLWNILMW